MTVLATALLVLAQVAPAGSPAATTPPPAPAGPIVVIETSQGEIRVALNPAKAPLTVENFLGYVKSGFYAGTIFHRVIPGFMIQGGGLDAKLVEKPTRPPVKNEARSGLRNLRGTLAMARTSDPHSATSQFFINLKSNPALDFGVSRDGWGYTVFGEVIEGMEVVDRIAGVPTTSRGVHEDVPRLDVTIKAVRVAPAAKQP
jgi:cyclophilin family peptidyl-prolyl cis-trans isomerase